MQDSKQPNNLMKYAGLGTQWLVMLLLAVLAGHWLDSKTGWKVPVFIITLPLVALGISLWQLIKEFSKPKK
ncbi:MAG: AtpZ/AtpI family protein [Bacteroidetes bacterium]|nr:AtpZ/AtpI family protein [Bacteroidota bacterium]